MKIGTQDIKACDNCGCFHDPAYSPCEGDEPTSQAFAPPEIRSTEWMDALAAALEHWKLYAQGERLDPDWPFEHSDEEATAFRQCKAVLDRASIDQDQVPRA